MNQQPEMKLLEPDFNKKNDKQQIFKFCLPLKKQTFYKQKSHLLKQKKFRELRFKVLQQEIKNKSNIEKYKNVIHLPIIQLRNKIYEFMSTKNILGIAITIYISQNDKFDKKLIQAFDQNLIQEFIKFSSNLLFHAQIVFIYKQICFIHSGFRQSILKKPQITDQIINYIQNLKGSSNQTRYIVILQSTILQDIQTNKQQLILDYFRTFYILTKQQIIDQVKGINILSNLCEYLKTQIFISNQIIQYIYQVYRNHIKKYKGRKIGRLNDCQFILITLFQNRLNVDIGSYFKALELFISSRKQLILYNQYFRKNKDFFYLLILVIITKISQTQIKLLYKQRAQLKKYLRIKNPYISEKRLDDTRYPLTTLICDYILRQNKFLLQETQYQKPYIILLNELKRVMDKNSAGEYILRQDRLNDVIGDALKKLKVTEENEDDNDQEEEDNGDSNDNDNDNDEEDEDEDEDNSDNQKSQNCEDCEGDNNADCQQQL